MSGDWVLKQPAGMPARQPVVSDAQPCSIASHSNGWRASACSVRVWRGCNQPPRSSQEAALPASNRATQLAARRASADWAFGGFTGASNLRRTRAYFAFRSHTRASKQHICCSAARAALSTQRTEARGARRQPGDCSPPASKTSLSSALRSQMGAGRGSTLRAGR